MRIRYALRSEFIGGGKCYALRSEFAECGYHPSPQHKFRRHNTLHGDSRQHSEVARTAKFEKSERGRSHVPGHGEDPSSYVMLSVTECVSPWSAKVISGASRQSSV